MSDKIYIQKIDEDLRNVEKMYGKDSDIYKFVRSYTIEAGVALVCRIGIRGYENRVEKKYASSRRSDRHGYENTIILSHKYKFGDVVLLKDENLVNVRYVCSGHVSIDGRNYADFCIIDEDRICAVKRSINA